MLTSYILITTKGVRLKFATGAFCIDMPLVALLSAERVRTEKIGLYDFVDEFDSRHDN